VHELALIKIPFANNVKVCLPTELVNSFHVRVVAQGRESLILETSETSERIDMLVEILRPCVILEMARSGRVAMAIDTKTNVTRDA
jgi:acetolactate synthase small subunit